MFPHYCGEYSAVDACVLLTAVLVGSSVGLFMAFQMKENSVQLTDPRAGGSTPHFYWGSFVAAGGVLCALLSSIFFICEGCRTDSSRSYDGYDAARTI